MNRREILLGVSVSAVGASVPVAATAGELINGNRLAKEPPPIDDALAARLYKVRRFDDILFLLAVSDRLVAVPHVRERWLGCARAADNIVRLFREQIDYEGLNDVSFYDLPYGFVTFEANNMAVFLCQDEHEVARELDKE